MKNCIWLPFFVVLIAVLSGCSSSNEVISDRGIQKRKYRKGFYVAHPTKVKQTQSTLAVGPLEEPQKMVSTVESNPAEEAEAPNAAEGIDQHLALSDFAEAQAPAPARASENHSHALTRPMRSHSPSAEPSKRSTRAQPAVTTSIPLSADHGAADDLELVLYILLSFLLPPLAVYLLYGISTNFWISVALTILLWLPGVVYALIHVINRKG